MAIELDLNNLNSPEDLNKAFEELSANGDEPAVKEPDVPEAEVKQPEPVTNEQQQAGTSLDSDESNAEGVATKDGKHVIPYSVLKSERDRASRAEHIAKDAQEQLATLEAQIKSGSQGANNGESARTNAEQAAVVDELSNEDLETLKEDFPTVYKAVMATKAQAMALEAKLKPVEDSVRNQEADRVRSDAESVQDAIYAVPKMAHIQANNAEAFELAKQFDSTLRNNPSWKDKSLSDRFTKVIEMVESATGLIDVPVNKPSSPSAEDLEKAARAKAATASKANGTNVPTSLSDFPAGQHAAHDEQEAAASMSTLQLAEKFSAMTPDQMDAYFRSL